MSKFLHVLLHVLAAAVQVANASALLVPAQYQGLVAAAVGLGQAILVYTQHKSA